jgi:hypothetical protein
MRYLIKYRSNSVNYLIWLAEMKQFANCERRTTDQLIALKEKQSKMIFENPTALEVCILEVDDCAITTGIRCDYALSADTIAEEFYIELKGRDIKHAFEQLAATFNQISEDPQRHPKYGFIISTRCPLTGPEIQKMQKLMKQKYNTKLIIKNRQHTHVLS